PHAQARAASAAARPLRDAGAVAGVAADHAGRALEADRRRRSDVADPRLAARDDRAAVPDAVDDQPAGSGLVLATLSHARALPIVRAVGLRLGAGAAGLPGCDRAVDSQPRPDVGLVRALRVVRAVVRGHGLPEPARARGCAG